MKDVVGDVIHKAMVLLGVELGQSRGEKVARAEKMAQAFVESAMEEAYGAVPWPFGMAQIRDFTSPHPLVFERVTFERNLYPNPINDGPINDVLRVVLMAPSQGREWYVDAGQHLWIKGGSIETCFYQSSLILHKMLGKPTLHISYCSNALIDDRDFLWVPDGYRALAGMGLAANVAYSLHSDPVFADGVRLSYLKKLEEYKKASRIDGFIINAYRM